MSIQDESQPSTEPTGGMDPNPQELVLVKHGQRYVFRYAPGEEVDLLDGLVDMARDEKSDLTWFDAAVLSHQLGVRIGHQLERISNPSMTDPSSVGPEG